MFYVYIMFEDRSAKLIVFKINVSFGFVELISIDLGTVRNAKNVLDSRISSYFRIILKLTKLFYIII